MLLAMLVDNDGQVGDDFRDPMVFQYLDVCDRHAAGYRGTRSAPDAALAVTTDTTPPAESAAAK